MPVVEIAVEVEHELAEECTEQFGAMGTDLDDQLLYQLAIAYDGGTGGSPNGYGTLTVIAAVRG